MMMHFSLSFKAMCNCCCCFRCNVFFGQYVFVILLLSPLFVFGVKNLRKKPKSRQENEVWCISGCNDVVVKQQQCHLLSFSGSLWCNFTVVVVDVVLVCSALPVFLRLSLTHKRNCRNRNCIREFLFSSFFPLENCNKSEIGACACVCAPPCLNVMMQVGR